jgi:hypothetical protein
MSIADKKIPISRTLFLVAVAHFLVWSIGVCEEPAKDFLIRETTSVSELAPPRQFTVDNLYIPEKATVNHKFNETQKELDLNIDKVQIVTHSSQSPISFFIPDNNYNESDSDSSNYD